MNDRKRRNGMIGALVALAALVAGFGPVAAGESRRPGVVVIGFSGWVPANDTYHGSAVETMIETLRARGLAGEVHAPGDWSSVAERLVAGPPPAGIIVLGYSKGVEAAISLAERLRDAAVPVRELVLLEGWKPAPIPANVRRAVHYYISSNTSVFDRLVRGQTTLAPGEVDPHTMVAGNGFTGSLRNVDLVTVIPGIVSENHVSMSHLDSVQRIVLAEILASARGRPDTRSRSENAALHPRGRGRHPVTR